jgi:hypothetical protein
MSAVFDFKSINRKFNCQEQKADFEAKNPLPDPSKVVWTPEWGYGTPQPYADEPTCWTAVEESGDGSSGISVLSSR